MNLREFKYKRSYTRGIDRPLKEFLIPVLSFCDRFYYITAYFSSKMLILLSYGIKEFIITNKGVIKLIIGCPFDNDFDIINMSDEELKEKFVEVTQKEFLSKELEKSPDQIEPLKLLAWLLYNHRIIIKWGIPIDSKFKNGTIINKGILHEKIGILKNSKTKDFVTFSGSMNATYYAWLENREEIKVFQSWIENTKDYAYDDLNKFKKYWKNEDPTLKVLDFPIKLKNKIIRKYLPKHNEIHDINFELIDRLAEKELKTISTWILYEKLQSTEEWNYREGCIKREIEYLEPYPHQKEALQYLTDNDFKGFLEMATGSGKTKTAILASYELYHKLMSQGINLLIVILVPDSYLIDQWYDELKRYTKNVIKCYSENHNWRSELRTEINRLLFNSIDHCYVVATTASFGFEIWDKFIIKKTQNRKNIKILLIGDEAHTLGSPLGIFLLNKLMFFFTDQYKIGLSATPVREYDFEGTQTVLRFFSNNATTHNVFTFSLKEAQEKGFLMKLNYFPIECCLSKAEFHNFIKMTRKIGSRNSLLNYNNEKMASELTKLLNLRANIIKKAADKLIQFHRLIQELINKDNKVLSKLVIFCKDREQVEQVKTQISLINRGLDLRYQIKFNTVDGEDDIQIRKSRFKDLVEEKINLLIVMKCLDRGVDIPSLEKAIFLASSGTELEHIQRTGRLLRKSPDKIKPVEIYDLFVFPTKEQIDENYNISQKIFEIEKKRIKFFMEIAENQDDIKDLLR
ncbi:MAG: DEAD/DEAH box helicase family protein, partial [Promethearchaeota archaeon]